MRTSPGRGEGEGGGGKVKIIQQKAHHNLFTLTLNSVQVILGPQYHILALSV